MRAAQRRSQLDSDLWLAKEFADEVLDTVFTGHTSGDDCPVLVLLGGQPAAGKTQARNAVLVASAVDDLVEIDGDEMRSYHPDYDRLAYSSPFLMPEVTSSVAGGLVELALDHALAHRYSVLLEGTFRDEALVTGTVTRFARAGYRVEIVAVATPAVVSRLSAEMRSLAGGFPEIGRWTPPAVHESALKYSSHVVSTLEALPEVETMQVFSRTDLLYDNVRREGRWVESPRAGSLLLDEQQRDLTIQESVAWLRDYAGVFVLAATRPGYLGAETASSYLQLQIDAEKMISLLIANDASLYELLSGEHRARESHLRQVLPPDV